MTRNACTFRHLTQYDGGLVTFGGKEKGRLVRRGTIKVGELIIDDTTLVKGLRHNLISISQLRDKGYEFGFKDGICTGNGKDPSQSFTETKYENIYTLGVTTDCLFFVKER